MFGGGYPPGAEHDPNAPYNQVEMPERDFDVVVCQSLSKQTTVSSNKYTVETDEECPDIIKTFDINWEKEYSKDHYTPLQLIDLFKTTLKHQLEVWEEMKGSYAGRTEISRIKYLIEECSNWVEDETEVIEEI